MICSEEHHKNKQKQAIIDQIIKGYVKFSKPIDIINKIDNSDLIRESQCNLTPPRLQLIGRVQCMYGNSSSIEETIESVGVLIASNLVMTIADNVIRRDSQYNSHPFKIVFIHSNQEYNFDNFQIPMGYLKDRTQVDLNIALLRLNTPIRLAKYCIIKELSQFIGEKIIMKRLYCSQNRVKELTAQRTITEFNQNTIQYSQGMTSYNACPLFCYQNNLHFIGFNLINGKGLRFTEKSIQAIKSLQKKLTKMSRILVQAGSLRFLKKHRYPSNCIGIIYRHTKQQEYCTGTGFLIARNIVLTCCSNLINPNDLSQIYAQTNPTIYFKLQNAEKIKIRKTIYLPKVLFSNKYQPEQNLAILLLDGAIEQPEYIRIAYDCHQSIKCKIKGYAKNEGEKYGKFTQKDVHIDFDMEQDYKVISYQFQRRQGSAGSPILFQFDGKVAYAVGMHIGDQIKYSFNKFTGLKFTKTIIQIIKKVQRKLTSCQRINFIDFKTRKLLYDAQNSQRSTTLKQQISQMQYQLSNTQIKSNQNELAMTIARQYLALGCKYIQNGQFRKAKDNLEQSKAIFLRQQCKQDSSLIDVYHNLGYALKELRSYDQALEMFHKAIELMEIRGIKDKTAYGMTFNSIGATFNAKGQLEQAMASFRKALQIIKSVHGEQHINVAIIYSNIAQIEASKQNFKLATSIYQTVKQIQEKHYGQDHPNISLAKTYSNLANTYFQLGQKSKGLHYRHESLHTMRILSLQSHPLYQSMVRHLDSDIEQFLMDTNTSKQDIETCIMILSQFTPESQHIQTLRQLLL